MEEPQATNAAQAEATFAGVYEASDAVLKAEAAGKEAASVAEANRQASLQAEEKRRAEMLRVLQQEHGELADGWQYHYDETHQRFFFHNLVLTSTTWD